MQDLTPDGQRLVNDMAQRTDFSSDAVATLLRAVAAGYGTQAQFNHPEFGGMGQWSQGGMIMIGDMFNQNLKYRVSALCDEISALLRSQTMFAAPASSQSQSQGSSWQNQGGGSSGFLNSGSSLFVQGPGSGSWWPAELGSPSSTGAQNDLRYAYFPAARRLAVQVGGQTRVYDTLDHNIGGFSQQQGGDQSVTFTSQYGLVRVADLPLVSPAGENASPPQSAPAQQQPAPFAPPAPEPVAAAPGGLASKDDIFSALERLADLRQKNILTEVEFAAKKAELLSRL
ncbi:SHOCT domain-containing protein [Rhodoblastus sp. 17X3]|uniref:SHOCT domain-containing protein n=1 Tax=Rhodoblastus sp. 17X3 TaxID=3047026 RepID=UPI0024B8710F|nr:SHOCT domain-containing protein [Rhodoblastus sp. 17X3]MDI9846937.1 SHOCT domain-containing protein [Rhodoblastus sp. 17X3]